MIVPLNDNGFTDFVSLGANATAVEANVRKYAPGATPGAINTLVALWTRESKAPANLGIPELKPGTTVDLTQSTATTSDGITFSIPKDLALNVNEPGKYPGASKLSNEQWLVILARTRALHGINFDIALTSASPNDAIVDESALVWQVPDNDTDWLDSQPTGGAHSYLSYTSEIQNLVHNGIYSGSLSVATPYVSGAASASTNERQASSRVVKTLYMTAYWRYQAARIALGLCTALSKKFLAAIDAALAAGTDKQFGALAAVFQRFGHAVSNHVAIGGTLYFHSSMTWTGDVKDTKILDTLNAAATAQYSPAGPSVTATASFTDGKDTYTAKQFQQGSVDFIPIGGDVGTATTPGAWGPTAQNPDNWAVIRRDREPDAPPLAINVPSGSGPPEGIKLLVDCLADLDEANAKNNKIADLDEANAKNNKSPTDRASRVQEIWTRGRKAIWKSPTPPQMPTYPHMNNAVFAALGGSGPPGPLAPAENCNEPATIAAANYSATIIATGMGWYLEYTGKDTLGNLTGDPLYRLIQFTEFRTPDQVSQLADAKQSAAAQNQAVFQATGTVDDYAPVPLLKGALASRQDDNGNWHVAVIEAEDARSGDAAKNNASWRLVLADPGDPKRASDYVLINWVSGKVLAPSGSNQTSLVDLNQIEQAAAWKFVPQLAKAPE
ncbi:MAG TPA: hypothetical protein VFH89_12495 [Sphingomicrobium sp.]|nr:hypothetical protein [Sphingomicrobium sp.]